MQVTESARKRLQWIIAEYATQVRLTVDGGGCAGFRYHFDTAEPQADDILVENLLHVDPVSMEMLRGATVDYVAGMSGQYFKVDIPEATSHCGCGHSFALAA